MKMYFVLFWIFAKIGAFTLGGGYAMLPLIEREIVDNKKWIDRPEFLDLVAIAQSAPGILAVNMAIFVGYKIKGTLGSVVATLGAVLPSFIIILLIALCFRGYKDNPVVARVFKGIRPAVVALIAVPVVNMGRTVCKRPAAWLIPAVVALGVWKAGVSPVGVVLAAGLIGWLWGRKK